jgi:hypothetical protein
MKYSSVREEADPDKAVKTEITEIAFGDNNFELIRTFPQFCHILHNYGILVNNKLKWYIFYLNVINDYESHEMDLSVNGCCKECGWSNLDGRDH